METQRPSLRDVATHISSLTGQISDYLEAHDLPTPSFSVDGNHELPSDLAGVRADLLSRLAELQDLVKGPEEMIVMEYPAVRLTPKS
jgi:hypothetical protein